MRAPEQAFAGHILAVPAQCPGVLADYNVFETDPAGNDIYGLTSASDLIVDTAGNNTINNTIDGGNDCIVTSGPNTTTGSGNDTIVAVGNGNNTINAGNGSNVVYGGTGNDTITTGTGADTIFSDEGNGSVMSGAGADCITSGSGNDTINSGAGADVVNPGVGNNTVTDSDQSPPPTGDCVTDSDSDRVPDATDNCDSVVNPTQTDSDNDGVGDACEVVEDTTPPTVTCGDDFAVEATSPSGAVVTWLASFCTASDLVDEDVTDCVEDVASGSTFALGDTTVTCSVEDASGNEGSDSFVVTVEDTTAPTVACGADITVSPDNFSGATVTWGASQCTASDLVDETVADCVETPASGSLFSLGETTVTCSVTDASGNTGSDTFFVKVLFDFEGFFQPIDMDDFNKVKAGSAIPIKFSLNGYFGLSIFETGYPKSVRVPCEAEEITEDEMPTVNAGQSSLTYDSIEDQYVYVWKTDKSWAGTCRELQVKLADDTVVTANFYFKK